MDSYVDCYECRNLVDNAKNRTPDLCNSSKAIEYHQNLHPERKIIPFSTDFNSKHDCRFVRLKFGVLVVKLFSG